ncbi:MAG: tetraacyldisaccharide 4'-kinase [Armatimonadota bacterium]
MGFIIYNLAIFICLPILAIFIFYRILISKKSEGSWKQQLGFSNIPTEISSQNKIWIHAVSVGESVASASVIGELKKAMPYVPIVVSTTTVTGQLMAKKTIDKADAFFYFPFDFPFSVWKAFKRVKPTLCASTDTEIWPNFLHISKWFGIKTAMINGTVSDATLKGGRIVPWLYKWALSNIDIFCMQSQIDADRIIGLGADPKKVIVTGNCKADQNVLPITDSEYSELKNIFKFPIDSKVFVAGSTNPGEDEHVLKAFLMAREHHKDLKIIIAPRHIEKKGEIVSIAESMGLKVGYKSDLSTITGNEDVIILDTFGELAKVYGIADVTFVGGSFIKRGCHSILQPISQGKPVFFGPYTFKTKDIASQSKNAGVGFEIENGEQLGQFITKLLSDKNELNEIKLRCEKMMQANLGASKRTADALIKLYLDSEQVHKTRKIPNYYLERVILGNETGSLSWVIRGLLYLPSILYGLIISAFVAQFDIGIRKRYKLDAKVISVGNITFGGTGKTPAVQTICKIIEELKMSSVILSRGHGGTAKSNLIVSDGMEILANSKEAGDEPMLLAKSLKSIPVIVGKDRRKTGKLACEKFNPDVVVLDDGLQYWQLDRDIDIVIIDALKPFGSGFMVPMGDLREPLNALNRAEIIIINNSQYLNDQDLSKLIGRVSVYSPDAKIFKAYHKVLEFVKASNNSVFDLSWIKGKRVVGFAGVAKPAPFFDMLKELGAIVVGRFEYPDHYEYNEYELNRIFFEKDKIEADAVITTEKDIARLGDTAQNLDNLFFLRIEMEIDERTEFKKHISERLNGKNKEITPTQAVY